MIFDPNLLEPPGFSRPPRVAPVARDVAVADQGAVLLLCPISSGPQTVVALVGEADISTAGQLREQFADVLASRPGSVLMDVTGLDFCDISGLDALGEAASAAADAGLVMTLQGCSPQLAWLLNTIAPRSGVRPVQVSGRVPSARQASASGPAA